MFKIGTRVKRSNYLLAHIIQTHPSNDYHKAVKERGTVTYVGQGIVAVTWDGGTQAYGPLCAYMLEVI